MKKSIFKILFVVAVLVGISIPNNVAAQQNVVDNDSLSIILGVSMGGNVANRIQEMPDSLPFKAKLSKDDIIKGFEYVLSIDTAKVGIPAGISMGMQLAGQIAQMEQMGAKIDRKKVIEEFSKVLKRDSVSMEEITKYQEFLQLAQGKLQAEAQRKYMEELENSPEAIANKKAGEEYIANLKKKDKKIKTTKSGLSYKIIEKGYGSKITDDDYVNVAYKGYLIDGTVFDDSNGEYREFKVNDVVLGFAEGLKLLGKGGKAIFYIPGKLGYGAQGQPAADIGPNEMIIFEVEIKY